MHGADWLLKLWVRLWLRTHDDEGSHTIEYIVIGTGVGLAALAGTAAFGDAIKGAFDRWVDVVK